jgi:hypothetical protein
MKGPEFFLAGSYMQPACLNTDMQLACLSADMQLARLNANAPGLLRNPLICPHCETECQAAGKVRNSWYALCRCGTYIQTCECVDDYYD